MGVFEEVTFVWKGKDHKIPPDKVMGAIAVVETYVTLKEITEQMSGANVKMVPIAMAYTSLLRYAGAEEVKTEEVYEEIFNQSEDGKKFGQQPALLGLLALMMPPAKMREALIKGGVKQPSGKTEPAATETGGSRSKRRTSSRSANGVSHQRPSGG